MELNQTSQNKVAGGTLTKYKFKSAALGGLDANFNIFMPSSAAASPAPLLVYLAGLTCTEDNGPQKGAFLSAASSKGIAILFPDTSPRGAGVEGEDDDWDFGTGAGFYLNATEPKFSIHYNMLTHVTMELPQVLEAAGLPIDFKRQSVFGHSMGGHGALTLYLSSILSGQRQYKSASAFSPICNPTQVPWGQKAFKGYLQGNEDEAKEKYDATELVKRIQEPVHILIDYGTADNFGHQLSPDAFEQAAKAAGHKDEEVTVRAQDGYDHSYYFISTFAEEHINFHAKFLEV